PPRFRQRRRSLLEHDHIPAARNGRARVAFIPMILKTVIGLDDAFTDRRSPGAARETAHRRRQIVGVGEAVADKENAEGLRLREDERGEEQAVQHAPAYIFTASAPSPSGPS